MLSEGRLDLGVGVGWQREEYEASGVRFNERWRRLSDTMAACRALWRGGPTHFASETVNVDDIYCSPVPEQKGSIPIWLGGGVTPPNLRRLVGWADGWIPIPINFQGPDAIIATVADGAPRVREAWSNAGRDPDLLQIRPQLPLVRKGQRVPMILLTASARCRRPLRQAQPRYPANGIKFAYSAPFSASAPDYTALCLAAKAAGVDALFAGGNVPTANQRVYDDCAQQGYRPLVMHDSSTFALSDLNDTAIQHAVGTTQTIPWFVNDSPGTAEFQQVMGSYLPKANSAPTTALIWAGLQVFSAAAKNIAVGAMPSAAGIYKGLYAFHDETLGGFTVPLTFGPGKTNTNTCAFAYAVTKGKLSMAYGTAPICGTS